MRIVGDEQDAAAAAGEPGDPRAGALALHGVDRGEWLVEQHEVAVEREHPVSRSRWRSPPERRAPRARRARAGQDPGARSALRAARRAVRRSMPAGLERQGGVPDRVAPRRGRGELREVGRVSARLRSGAARELERAGRGGHEAGERPQQGVSCRCRCVRRAHELAGGEGEGDVP